MSFIGIDVGSTCTKVVALESNKLVFQKVVPTGWNCRETVKSILEEMESLGLSTKESKSVATGYGRISISFADKTVTEISCHSKGAAWLFGGNAFIVIDIGGQDTKIIDIKGGQIQNFIMNDKCSAGTGRFLDIMAGTMGVSLETLCEMAKKSTTKISISSMCTVFAESEVVSLIGKGTPKEDIANAIVNSIVAKVWGQMGKLQCSGKKLYLTGGLCEIPLICEMLSQKIGADVNSVPLARFAGAIGAALYASKLK